MRRSQSRAASPTPTAFSGISNYKTESYRPIGKDKSAPAVPQIDYRTVSKIHFDELSSYLAAYLARCTSHKGPSTPSANEQAQQLRTPAPPRDRSSRG